MNKHLIWATSLLLITLMICGTLIWINYNSWTVRFEMDDNTKEAIKSIEFPIVNYMENCTFDIETCNNICCDGEFCTTTLMSNNWCKKFNYSQYDTLNTSDSGGIK